MFQKSKQKKSYVKAPCFSCKLTHFHAEKHLKHKFVYLYSDITTRRKKKGFKNIQCNFKGSIHKNFYQYKKQFIFSFLERGNLLTFLLTFAFHWHFSYIFLSYKQMRKKSSPFHSTSLSVEIIEEEYEEITNQKNLAIYWNEEQLLCTRRNNC